MGVQEVDIVSIVTPITKYAVMILEPETIRYHLERAVHLARTGRPGPVWIDIPLDVQAATIDPETLQGFTPEVIKTEQETGKLSELVSSVIELLNAAERPILLAGNGIRLSRAQPDFSICCRSNILSFSDAPAQSPRAVSTLLFKTLTFSSASVHESISRSPVMLQNDWLVLLRK